MTQRTTVSSALSTLVIAFVVSGCGGGGGGSSGGGGGGGALSTYNPADKKTSTKSDTNDVVDTSTTTPALNEPGAPAPKSYLVTPEGVKLYYPVWLDLHPEKKAEMLAEIRGVTPEADARIDASARGVPAGTTLTVLDPGAYYAPYSPTGLASGEWRGGQTIFVAWRGGSSGTLLPALSHELRHMLTQDATAGH